MGERSVQKNRRLGKKHGRIWILACIFMLSFALWQFHIIDAFAKTGEECGDFLVTGGTKGVDYIFHDGVLRIQTDMPITIQNIDPTTATKDRIEIEGGANLTLAGVNIATRESALWIRANAIEDVIITLADDTDNILKAGGLRAGLEKSGDSKTGTLTITGNTGTLTAIGGKLGGAGIGGAHWYSGCNIVINGGVIAAEGGEQAAGIGGGYFAKGNHIIINGGYVTAIGGEYGAGIGGGERGTGSDIIITGGEVTATGGEGGAGIGGGLFCYGGNIIILGGNVTATGRYGEDIGNGGEVSDSTISSSLIIDGKAGVVKGDVTLKSDLIIASDVTLTIERDASLSVGEYGLSNVILINHGVIDNNGIIDNRGIINNSGIINNNGIIEGDGIIYEDRNIEAVEPQTGDDNLLWLYSILAIMALAGIYIIKTEDKKANAI